MRAVIVGAGPAGLISALNLLNLIQEGVSPMILDKQSAIMSAACGEACDVEFLNNIPFDSNQYICTKVRGAQVVCAGGSCSYVNKTSVTLD